MGSAVPGATRNSSPENLLAPMMPANLACAHDLRSDLMRDVRIFVTIFCGALTHKGMMGGTKSERALPALLTRLFFTKFLANRFRVATRENAPETRP